MFRLVYYFLRDGAIIYASVLGCSECLELSMLLLLLSFCCVKLIIHCIPGASLRLHSKGCTWLRGNGLSSKSQHPITILGSIFSVRFKEVLTRSRLKLCMTAPGCWSRMCRRKGLDIAGYCKQHSTLCSLDCNLFTAEVGDRTPTYMGKLQY